MARLCTRCGTPNDEPAARFCPQCGGLLADAPAGAAPVSPPPPAPTRPASALEGARCALHPDAPATDLCARCGNFACPACTQLDAWGRPHCTTCAARVSLGRWDIPWERRSELGLVKGFWQTAKAAAFEPVKTMAGLEPDGEWWDAMSYAMVCYGLSISGTILLYGLIGAGVGAFALGSARDHVSPLLAVGIALGVVAAIAVSIPIGAIIRVYVGAGIDYLLLLLVGGGRAGFNATFRGYCYGLSPAMFGVIPGCGIYIWEIWRMACQILAYKSVHQMPGGRAAAAVISPVVLCCGGYFLFLFGIQLFQTASH